MIFTIAAVAIILSNLALLTSVSRVALAVVASGAAGAFVSVASRLTRGTPLVAYKERAIRLAVFGAIRPIVGAVLGAAVCAVLVAGLMPTVRILPPTGKEVLTYSALAFIAGFSERFAQDVLLKTSLRSK